MRAGAVEHCDPELIAELGQPDVFVFGLVLVFLLDVDIQTRGDVSDPQGLSIVDKSVF